MWLLPYEKYSIITDLSPDEATKRLVSTIYVPDGYLFPEKYDTFSTKYFTGYINGNLFDLNLNVVPTRNMLPDISGRISPLNDGSMINIKITQKVSYYFFSFCLIFLLVAGVSMNLSSKEFERSNLLPFVMAFLVYCLALFNFKYQTKDIKGILTAAFEGEAQ